MSEPELPGIPPPPLTPTPPREPWYKRLSARWKWPGWAFILLLVIEQVPDWKGRLDFWLDAAKEAGGYAGAAAIVIASPYFSLGMAAVGVLWLAFVGEPRRGIQRHPWLPYLGWAVAAFLSTVIVLTAGWGALQVYVNGEVSRRTTQQFWHLTDGQAKTLSEQLDNVPGNQRFPIYFRMILANSQALTMGGDLVEIFRKHGWNVSGTQDLSLRPDLLGINFVVAIDQGRIDKDQPPHAQVLSYMLDKAQIKYSVAWEPKFDNNSLQLAIGSRPPNW